MINTNYIAIAYGITIALLLLMYVIKMARWLLNGVCDTIKRLFTPRRHSQPRPSPDSVDTSGRSKPAPTTEPERCYELEVHDAQLQRIVSAQATNPDIDKQAIAWRCLQPKRKTGDAYDTFYQRIRTASGVEAIGEIGEKMLARKLSQLKRKGKLSWFLSTENMLVGNRDFEIDFLAKLPNGRLLVIEAKLYGGEVYCSNQYHWQQKIKEQDKSVGNAAAQVKRALHLTKQILKADELDYYLTPLVVMIHPQARVFLAEGAHAPQCDVILLEDLECWLDNLHPSGFETADLANIRAVFAAAA